MLFHDRIDAVNKLLPKLEHYKEEDCVVLAIPRGGVPMGKVVADFLNCPFDILLSKKIGHPFNEEFAIGSVTLDDYEVDELYHSEFRQYIDNEIPLIQNELKRRKEYFIGSRKQVDIKDKTVIIIDDGIATGKTLFAAIKVLRRSHPAKIVVAVPVAPLDTANVIYGQADDFIVIFTPEYFSAISQFYKHFEQVSDEEVKMILAQRTRNKE